jgi:hypothetical protein
MMPFSRIEWASASSSASTNGYRGGAPVRVASPRQEPIRVAVWLLRLARLLLEPDARSAIAGIARVEKDNTGMVERFLYRSERARTRISPTPLQVFHSDFGKTRRPSQLDLYPIEHPRAARICPGVIILIR